MMRSSVNVGHRSKHADSHKYDDEEPESERRVSRKHSHHSHSEKERSRDHKRPHDKDEDLSGKKKKFDDRKSRKHLHHAADLPSDSDDFDVKHHKPSSNKVRTDGVELVKNGLIQSHRHEKSYKSLVDYGEDSSDSVSPSVPSPKMKKVIKRKSETELSKRKARLSELGSDIDVSDNPVVNNKPKHCTDKPENDGRGKKHSKYNDDACLEEKVQPSVKERGKSRTSSGSSFPEQLSTSLNKILEQEFDLNHSSSDRKLVREKSSSKNRLKSGAENEGSIVEGYSTFTPDEKLEVIKVNSQHKKSKRKAADDTASDSSFSGWHKAETLDCSRKHSKAGKYSRHHQSKGGELDEVSSDAENSASVRTEKSSSKRERKSDNMKVDARNEKDKKWITGNQSYTEHFLSSLSNPSKSTASTLHSERIVHISKSSNKQKEKQSVLPDESSDMDDKNVSKSRPFEKQRHKEAYPEERKSKKKRTISEEGEVSSPETSRYDHQSRHHKTNSKTALELPSSHSRNSHKMCFDRNDRDASRTSRSSSRPRRSLETSRSGRSTSKSRTTRRASRSKSPNAIRQIRRSKSRTRRSKSGHRRSSSRDRHIKRSRSGSRRRRSRRSRSRDVGIELPPMLNRRTVVYATSLAAELTRRRQELAGKPERIQNASDVKKSTAPTDAKSNARNEPIVIIDSDDSDSGSSSDPKASRSPAGFPAAPVLDVGILSAIPMPQPKEIPVPPASIPLPKKLGERTPSSVHSALDNSATLSLCPSEIPVPEQATASLPRVVAPDEVTSVPSSAALEHSASSVSVAAAVFPPPHDQINVWSHGHAAKSPLSEERSSTTTTVKLAAEQANEPVPSSITILVPALSETLASSSLSQLTEGVKGKERFAVDEQLISVGANSVSLSGNSKLSTSGEISPFVNSSPANALAAVQVKLATSSAVKSQSSSPATTPEKTRLVNVQKPFRRLTELPMPPNVYEEDSSSATEDLKPSINVASSTVVKQTLPGRRLGIRDLPMPPMAGSECDDDDDDDDDEETADETNEYRADDEETRKARSFLKPRARDGDVKLNEAMARRR